MQIERVTSAIVIDGGFATQLTVHVGNHVDGHPLWSALFNFTNKNAVIQTHLDYLKAGSKLIRTNTYQTSVDGYKKYLNLDNDESIELIRDTVKLAHTARSLFLSDNPLSDSPWIFASIGPYGASLHDGSEYTGSYANEVSIETIKNWHRVRIQAVIDVGVDALAIETIPCLMEAEALIELMCDEHPNVKYWISFQCKDETSLAHGETFSESALKIWNNIKSKKFDHNLLAIGVNCVNPKFVTPLFQSLNGNKSKDQQVPLVVYANSGENYDVVKGWDGLEHTIPSETFVPEWIDLGALYIGGCCQTYANNTIRFKDAIEKYYK